MIIKHESELEYQRVEMDGARNVYIKWLIGEDSAAPNFYLRQLQVMGRGHTPYHQHPYEHEVYVIHGEGILVKGEDSVNIQPGSFALIPAGIRHQFKNPNPQPLVFLCLIPREPKTQSG